MLRELKDQRRTRTPFDTDGRPVQYQSELRRIGAAATRRTKTREPFPQQQQRRRSPAGAAQWPLPGGELTVERHFPEGSPTTFRPRWRIAFVGCSTMTLIERSPGHYISRCSRPVSNSHEQLAIPSLLASSDPPSMAITDTGSSFAQWAGLYDPPELSPDCAAAADGHNNVVAAAGMSPTKAAAAAHQRPGIEGPRVGKPARRRSRASRRAPVTLLNTDTANFRAMVQQFTGIPAPPAAAFGGPAINFAPDYGFPPPAGVMSFDHRHHHSPAPLDDQLLRRQQQQPPQYTGGAFGYNGHLLHGAGAGDMFASSAEDRMLLQSMRAAQMMPPASAANNNTSHGFFA